MYASFIAIKCDKIYNIYLNILTPHNLKNYIAQFND